jgi:hypothetical protein
MNKFILLACCASITIAGVAQATPSDPLDPNLPKQTDTDVAPIVQDWAPPPVVVVVEQPAPVPQELPPAPPPLPKIVVVQKPRFRFAVADINCGVPSGCVGEMGIRPFYWLKLEVGAGYNGLAPGVIGSVVVDPIPFGIGVSLSMDVGHYWAGTVPGVSNSPSVEYSFVSPMVGLEFGNHRAWRFYLRGGLSYIDATGSNFQSLIGNNNSNGVAFGNPHIDAWVAPAFKLGMSFYF